MLHEYIFDSISLFTYTMEHYIIVSLICRRISCMFICFIGGYLLNVIYQTHLLLVIEIQ